jgi:FixJ family two-component response regulator
MISRDFTVFLIDDDASVLKALARLIQAAGYKTKAYRSSKAFLDEHDSSIPGCALLDLSMTGLNGLAVQQTLKRQEVSRPIIFLAGRGAIRKIIQAMKQGAIDVLIRPINQSELVHAVECAEKQDNANRRADAECRAVYDRLKELTPREREVLTYVIGGNLNKQIAAALGTVEKTIKVHRSRIMIKMEVRSVAQLVRMTEKISLQPFQTVNSVSSRAS